jgi:hypothetical protein
LRSPILTHAEEHGALRREAVEGANAALRPLEPRFRKIDILTAAD